MNLYRKITSASFNKSWFITGFAFLYILSILVHLGYFPLNGDEPRRALVSIEMLHSGNFIRPTTMGWEYYNKPPVYNWFISLCMFLSGSTSEMSVRLPSLLSIMAWGICNYFIVKRFLPGKIAALSSLFMITSFDIFFWGLFNGGEIDIFYSFIVYLQVILIFYFNQQKKWLLLFLVSYLFCAIGMLTKGFPSILFEEFTLLALCVFNKSVKVIFRWQHLAGIVFFLIVTGGYFYAYSFHGVPDVYLADLLKESFNKSGLGEYADRFFSKVLQYPFSFFKILLPWSLVLLFLFKKHKFRLWSAPLLKFCLLFIIFNIPVYWFTGHPRMRYVYMFIPFCMIILAYIFYHIEEEYPGLIKKVFKKLSFLFVFAILALVVLPFLYKMEYLVFGMTVVLFLVYIFLYRKAGWGYVWYFGTGIVLLRLVYAMLLIPLKYEKTDLKYDKQMAAIAAVNQYQPLNIYRTPDTLGLVIDLKLTKIDFGTIPAIPYLAYQMPYYYYRSTGHIVNYDTILQMNRNYMEFESAITDQPALILYSFKDYNQNNDNVVLFQIPENE